MFGRLFGTSAAQKPPPPSSGASASARSTTQGNDDVMSVIAELNKRIASLEKGEAHKEEKIQACVAEAKKKMARNDKKGAMLQLKRKKEFEKQIEVYAGSRMKLEQQLMAIESASVNSATLAALSRGNEAMVQQRKKNGIDEDKVDDIFAAFEDEMAVQQEISEHFTQGTDEIVEDEDLLNELAELQVDDAVEVNAPTAATKTKPTAQPPAKSVFNLPEAPDAPVASTTDEVTEEEKELRALQASMGL